MSIQSTERISRRNAIERIKLVHALIANKDYQELEEKSFEADNTVHLFIPKHVLPDISNIEKWTNKMLEEQLDQQYYRVSMFINYVVED